MCRDKRHLSKPFQTDMLPLKRVSSFYDGCIDSQNNRAIIFLTVSLKTQILCSYLDILIERVLHALVLKHQLPHTVRCCGTLFLLCLKRSAFNSCLFKAPPFPNTPPPLIGRLTHASASTADINRTNIAKSVLD